MKLLLSSLLLASLCALSPWSASSETLVVTQSPDASVTEGDTVKITCCWTGEAESMTVNWLKNQTSIKSERISKNHSQVSLQKEASDCYNLTFTNITRENSGRYTCRVSVEIPFLYEFEGNGTVITVTSREKTNDNSKDNTKEESTGEQNDTPSSSLPTPVIITLAVAAPLLLITAACFCILRRRQAQAARVIYEVPHIDSEEPEMDKHSTSSSRGSSQWCQVPVYESVDYFERVQTKESG